MIVAGFLAGSVPWGVIVAKQRGVDIRAKGSGNIGATNVARVLGARLGLIVLLLDATKGALPVLAVVLASPRGKSSGAPVCCTRPSSRTTIQSDSERASS